MKRGVFLPISGRAASTVLRWALARRFENVGSAAAAGRPGVYPGGVSRARPWPRAALLLAAWIFFALVALPIVTSCALLERPGAGFWLARRDPSGQAPDPAEAREAVLQVYAARAVRWRGILAVHTWVAVKPSGAAAYTRYEVIGWGVDRGIPAIRVNRTGPDNHWFGSRPQRLADLRGDGVDELIARVEAAVRAYPYQGAYRTWPGPNSNTFTAYIGRAVPELGLHLPPTAIGKDYLAGGALAGPSPSGTGVQLSLLGLAGILVGWEEGIELNLLGLTLGVDLRRPALKLPGVGRLGFRAAAVPPD